MEAEEEETENEEKRNGRTTPESPWMSLDKKVFPLPGRPRMMTRRRSSLAVSSVSRCRSSWYCQRNTRVMHRVAVEIYRMSAA